LRACCTPSHRPGPCAIRRWIPRPGSSSWSCDLLRTFACHLDLAARRLLRLLREGAQDHHLPAGRRHVESPGDPGLSPQPHLPDPALDMLDVGFMHPLKPDGLNQPHDAFEARARIRRQSIELRLGLGIHKDERPCHAVIYLFCNNYSIPLISYEEIQ